MGAVMVKCPQTGRDGHSASRSEYPFQDQDHSLSRCLISIVHLVTGCKSTGEPVRTTLYFHYQVPSLAFGLLNKSIQHAPHTTLVNTLRSTDRSIPHCLSKHYDRL